MKNILLIRERFDFMGSYSGYDILFENSAFKDSRSFFIGGSFSVKSVLRVKKVFRLLGIPLLSWLVTGFLGSLKPPRIRGRKSFSERILDDLAERHNLRYMRGYDKRALLQEMEVIAFMLNNPLEHFYVHLSYVENMFGLLATEAIRARFPNLRIIGTVHQPMSWWRLYGNLKLLGNADSLIVLSESERTAWTKIFPEKMAYIPHGVCSDFFVPAVQKKTEFACVFAGQWLRDFSMLAEIVDTCAGFDKSIAFHLIVPIFTRNKENLRREMFRLAKHENVHWYSSLDDEALRTVYQSSHVLVMPLLDCTANNAVLESIACGLPVIASRLASLDSYLSPEFGTQVAGSNPLEFVNEIVRYKNDSAEWHRASVCARKGAESKAWTGIAERTLEVYRAIRF